MARRVHLPEDAAAYDAELAARSLARNPPAQRHAGGAGNAWTQVSALANAVLLVLLFFLYESCDSGVGLVASTESAMRRAEVAKDLADIRRDVQDTAANLERVRGAGDAQSLPTVVRTATTPCPTVGAAGSTASTDAPASLWMAIGIPTVRRKGDVDYLTPTLESLLSELPDAKDDPLWGRVVVYVMNNEPVSDDHVVFKKTEDYLRRTYGEKFEAHARFVVNPRADSSLRDPVPLGTPEPDDLNNPMSIPGKRARKQTLDVVALMRRANRDSPTYFMFYEDDFRACAHSMRALQYVIARANAMHAGKWCGIRVSYGLNGIVVRRDDLRWLDDYFVANVKRLPVDLLWHEWAELGTAPRSPKEAVFTSGMIAAVRGRRQYVYEKVLYSHIGEVSSFEVRPPRARWPTCYDGMDTARTLADNERFSAHCRAKSDLSPCDAQSAASAEWVSRRINFGP